MKGRKQSTALATLLALVAAAVVALPASATSDSFSGDGCYGTGVTEATGVTNQLRSKTDAWKDFTATPCNYTFTQGYYLPVGGTQYVGPIGPGWGTLGQQVSYTVSNAMAADDVQHNACWAGGPCSGATTPGWTSY